MVNTNSTPPNSSGVSPNFDSLTIDRIVKAVDKMQGLLTDLDTKVLILSKSLEAKDLMVAMQKRLTELETQNKNLSQQIATIANQNKQLKTSVASVVEWIKAK